MNFLESLFPASDSEEWVFVDKKARRRFVFGYRARRDGANRNITLDCDDAHHTFFDRMTVTPNGILLHRFNLLTETVEIADPGWLLTESQESRNIENILPPDRNFEYRSGPFVGKIWDNCRYEAYLAGQERPADFWRVSLTIAGEGGNPLTATLYFEVGAGLIRYRGHFNDVVFDYRRQPETLWKHNKESERLHKPEPTDLDRKLEDARSVLIQLGKDIERLGEALAQPVTPFTQEAVIRRFERAWDGCLFGIQAIVSLDAPGKELPENIGYYLLARDRGWVVDSVRWISMGTDRGKGRSAHEPYLVGKLFKKIVWHHSTLMDCHDRLSRELLKWNPGSSYAQAAKEQTRTSFALFQEQVHPIAWNTESGETVLRLCWDEKDRTVGKADSMTAAIDLAMAWMIKNLDI